MPTECSNGFAGLREVRSHSTQSGSNFRGFAATQNCSASVCLKTRQLSTERLPSGFHTQLSAAQTLEERAFRHNAVPTSPSSTGWGPCCWLPAYACLRRCCLRCSWAWRGQCLHCTNVTSEDAEPPAERHGLIQSCAGQLFAKTAGWPGPAPWQGPSPAV